MRDQDSASQTQVQHNGPARKIRNCADTSWHSVTILMRPAPLRRSQFKFGIFVSHSEPLFGGKCLRRRRWCCASSHTMEKQMTETCPSLEREFKGVVPKDTQ